MEAPIVILGGRGMLGTDLAACLVDGGVAVRVADLPECDITRPSDLERALAGAGAVVNCAAYTAVDRAESQPELARAVNALAVGTLGAMARDRGLYVAHVSTDFVFDGTGDRPWTETDAPRPLSVYGRTKWEGERLLQDSGCAHSILRIEWSYGRHGAHFISKFVERGRGGGTLKVVNDQVGAPTWTRESAGVLRCLLSGRREGIYHFANAGFASRYEVARFVAARLGLACAIVPCASRELREPAERPANSRLATANIRAILAGPIRSWQEALGDFLDAEFRT